jgi:hypothetical protein
MIRAVACQTGYKAMTEAGAGVDTKYEVGWAVDTKYI